MARYLESQVDAFLRDRGCRVEESYGSGQVWVTANGIPFTVPAPIDGHFDADVLDRILADQWIWTVPPGLQRHPD